MERIKRSARTIRLPDEMWAKVDEAADKTRHNPSGLIEWTLTYAFGRQDFLAAFGEAVASAVSQDGEPSS